MRLAIADDSALLRQGLARLLTDDGCEVLASVGDAPALLRAVDADPPDAVLVDIRMPPSHTDEGIVAAQAIRERHPGVAILVLASCLESEYAARLLREVPARAGYVLKERHVRSIFLKLDLTVSPDDDRRVLAVLTMLRSMP